MVAAGPNAGVLVPPPIASIPVNDLCTGNVELFVVFFAGREDFLVVVAAVDDGTVAVSGNDGFFDVFLRVEVGDFCGTAASAGVLFCTSSCGFDSFPGSGFLVVVGETLCGFSFDVSKLFVSDVGVILPGSDDLWVVTVDFFVGPLLAVVGVGSSGIENLFIKLFTFELPVGRNGGFDFAAG